MNESIKESESSGPQAAQGIAWDLSDLYKAPSDPLLEQDEKRVVAEAEAFAAEYRGSINIEGGLRPAFLAEALKGYENLIDGAYKPLAFARLLHAADSGKQQHGALLSHTQQVFTRIQTTLMFFELDWIALPDEAARSVLQDPAVSRWKHFLTSIRRYKPHTLSEAEEIILAEKEATGASAFQRLYDEVLSLAHYEIKIGEQTSSVNQSRALALLHDSTREVRQAAHEGFTRGLMGTSHLTTFILNNIVHEHAVNDRLKDYSSPEQSRHLANEITAESVDALLLAVERRHDLVHDYYALKARLLGLDSLFDYDRYAPVELEGTALPLCSWQEARRMVLEAYTDFSPLMGDVASKFFDHRWIDAEPREGKRGGAFSSSTVPSVHPYILLNFTGKLNDVMTLAHELGHGVHQYLSRPHGILQNSTPLTLAETASVFGEMLVFDRLIREMEDPRARLSLLCHKLEDSFATVFRQVVLTRFEQSLHQARSRGELSSEEMDALWMQSNEPMYGASVQLTDGYRRWWSYIGHFVHSPFYCYAYSFGELLVLALWSQYKKEGKAFVSKYMELLAAGGSDTPHNLLNRVGLNINAPEFWDSGLTILAELLVEARELAAAD